MLKMHTLKWHLQDIFQNVIIYLHNCRRGQCIWKPIGQLSHEWCMDIKYKKKTYVNVALLLDGSLNIAKM